MENEWGCKGYCSRAGHGVEAEVETGGVPLTITPPLDKH